MYLHGRNQQLHAYGHEASVALAAVMSASSFEMYACESDRLTSKPVGNNRTTKTVSRLDSKLSSMHRQTAGAN